MRTIVVGSGAGGATAARELARQGMEVVVLEAGGRFKPFTRRIGFAEPIRRMGLLGGEDSVSRFIPAYRTTRSSEELLLVRSVAVGGCTLVNWRAAWGSPRSPKKGGDPSPPICSPWPSAGVWSPRPPRSP